MITEIKERKGKQHNRTTPEDTYVRVFLVTSDDKDEDPDVIPGAVAGLDQVPEPGDAYSLAVPDALCTGVKVTQFQDNWFKWTATASYSNAAPDSVLNDDPTDDDPIYAWGEQVITVTVDETTDVPVENIDNSANDKFNPPLTQDENLRTLRVTRNVATFNPNQAATFSNSINDDLETLNVPNCVSVPAAAETLYLASYTARQGVRDGVDFWTESIFLVYRPDGWDRVLLDAGLRRLDGNGDQVVIILQGIPVTEPVPLDGAGQPLSATGDFATIGFRTRTPEDFSILGLAP